jgi:type IV secretion system protein TrbL
MKKYLLLLFLLFPLIAFAQGQQDAQRFTGVNPAPFNENAGRERVDRNDATVLDPFEGGGQARSLSEYSTAGVGEALDEIPRVFAAAAGNWIDPIMNVAKALFFILASIEIVWAGIVWVLSRETSGSIMSTLFKKMFILMFFYWVLLNGFPLVINMINNFFIGTAADAGGLDVKNLSPSGIAMVGVDAFTAVLGASFGLDVKLFIAMFLIMLIVVISFLMIAAQLIVALVEAYIMLSAGLLFLGFAGSNFTKTYAEKYFGLAFGTGVKLFFTYLIAGLAYAITSGWTNDFKRMVDLAGGENTIAGQLGRFAWNNLTLFGYFFHQDGSVNEHMMLVGSVVMLAVSLILAYLTMTIPKRAESLMSGGPNMGLGETIGAGAGVVGAMSSAGGAAVGAIAGSTLARSMASTAGSALSGGASMMGQGLNNAKNALFGGSSSVPPPSPLSSNPKPDSVPPPKPDDKGPDGGGGPGPTGGNGPSGSSGPTGQSGGNGPSGGSGGSGQSGPSGGSVPTPSGSGSPTGRPTPTGSGPTSSGSQTGGGLPTGSGSQTDSGGPRLPSGSESQTGSGLPTGSGQSQTGGQSDKLRDSEGSGSGSQTGGQSPKDTTGTQSPSGSGSGSQTDSTGSAKDSEISKPQPESQTGSGSQTGGQSQEGSGIPRGQTDSTGSAKDSGISPAGHQTDSTGANTETSRPVSVDDNTGSAKVQDTPPDKNRSKTNPLRGLDIEDRHTVSGEGLRIDDGNDTLKTGD